MSDTTPETPTSCEYCDGTGDVHRIDGEWMGECQSCTPETPTAGQDGETRWCCPHCNQEVRVHALAAQLAQAQLQLESAREVIQESNIESDRLRQQLAQARGEVERLDRDRVERTEYKKLEQELTEMEKDKHVIQHERDEYYAELEQARLKDSLRERGLDPDVTTLRVEALVKDQRIMGLEQQLAQAQGEVERLKAEAFHQDDYELVADRLHAEKKELLWLLGEVINGSHDALNLARAALSRHQPEQS